MPIDYEEFNDGIWRPTRSGAQLIGDVILAEVVEIEEGKRAPALTVMQDDGEPAVLRASQVSLRRLLMENDVQEGDRIKVTYDGEKHLGQGKKAKNFTLRVMKGGSKTKVPDVVEHDPLEDPFA